MKAINFLGCVVAVVCMLIGMIYDGFYLLIGQITHGSSVYFGAGMFLGGLLFLLQFISAAQIQEKLNTILNDRNPPRHE